ncbi:MAG: hypothetical protein PHV51_07675 [Methanosarcinaceae archaeon]|nr:hypothetical protein [Methanosarcinaceae archaeon]
MKPGKKEKRPGSNPEVFIMPSDRCNSSSSQSLKYSDISGSLLYFGIENILPIETR